ncbi:uncharacterized protein ARMOST_08383 [Armillaria ostoyae]|uniref:Uncharacterized protein n=1 Tax=Armillaria ostoyae TaxID=47428 RepID=A0A284R8J3_ARMOS|nr:uncharacterized protein ARMOST_08383 [Armillaria ostoyae]
MFLPRKGQSPSGTGTIDIALFKTHSEKGSPRTLNVWYSNNNYLKSLNIMGFKPSVVAASACLLTVLPENMACAPRTRPKLWTSSFIIRIDAFVSSRKFRGYHSALCARFDGSNL